MYGENMMNSCENPSLFCWISAFPSAFSHFKLHECLLQSLDVLNSEKICIFLGSSVLVEILAFVSLRFNKNIVTFWQVSFP